MGQPSGQQHDRQFQLRCDERLRLVHWDRRDSHGFRSGLGVVHTHEPNARPNRPLSVRRDEHPRHDRWPGRVVHHCSVAISDRRGPWLRPTRWFRSGFPDSGPCHHLGRFRLIQRHDRGSVGHRQPRQRRDGQLQLRRHQFLWQHDQHRGRSRCPVPSLRRYPDHGPHPREHLSLPGRRRQLRQHR